MNSLYNLEYLRELSGDDLFIKDMVETFTKESPQNYYKLRRHFINRNFAAMKEVVHQFKNAATYIGNDRLLKELTALENLIAKGGDTMSIRNNLNQIDLLVHDIVSKLRKDFKLR